MLAVLKRPSAFLPPVISAVVLALILVHIARFGLIREADEGAAAHLFQLLMPAQMVIIAFFALKWVPRAPRAALQVLALQGVAALAVLALVFFLRL